MITDCPENRVYLPLDGEIQGVFEDLLGALHIEELTCGGPRFGDPVRVKEPPFNEAETERNHTAIQVWGDAQQWAVGPELQHCSALRAHERIRMPRVAESQGLRSSINNAVEQRTRQKACFQIVVDPIQEPVDLLEYG